MTARRETKFVIIHCSATRPSQDIGKREIDKWHRQRGWQEIGYHYVIRRDGTPEIGRHIDEIGAHTYGQNAWSVGICLVGGVAENGKTSQDNFTQQQMGTLKALVTECLRLFPGAKVFGHRDFSNKACPSFDAASWWNDVMWKEEGG